MEAAGTNGYGLFQGASQTAKALAVSAGEVRGLNLVGHQDLLYAAVAHGTPQ